MATVNLDLAIASYQAAFQCLDADKVHCKAMMDKCRMDGRADNFEGYSKQTRPLAAQHPLCELPKKLPADDLYEPQEVPAPPDPPERKHKTMCGQTLSSFPQYRRIKDLK